MAFAVLANSTAVPPAAQAGTWASSLSPPFLVLFFGPSGGPADSASEVRSPLSLPGAARATVPTVLSPGCRRQCCPTRGLAVTLPQFRAFSADPSSRSLHRIVAFLSVVSRIRDACCASSRSCASLRAPSSPASLTSLLLPGPGSRAWNAPTSPRPTSGRSGLFRLMCQTPSCQRGVLRLPLPKFLPAGSPS